jgi:hypothetical protein
VTSHIPPERHGILGSLSPEKAKELRAMLAKRLME